METPTNERQVLLLTNNDGKVLPLIILFPQWSKASLDKMTEGKQLKLYEEFGTIVSEAWEKLMREK